MPRTVVLVSVCGVYLWVESCRACLSLSECFPLNDASTVRPYSQHAVLPSSIEGCLEPGLARRVQWPAVSVVDASPPGRGPSLWALCPVPGV